MVIEGLGYLLSGYLFGYEFNRSLCNFLIKVVFFFRIEKNYNMGMWVRFLGQCFDMDCSVLLKTLSILFDEFIFEMDLDFYQVGWV